ncbi:M50 family metallopeptidase [Actinoplanes sp. NPDC048967]|uniref:M50 family metallopeptidase n=1 Tax=Actinoplanes sp. NPDC048967 TaxID=3155269 RepID=UPI00340C0E86
MEAPPGIAWTAGVVAFVAAVPLWRFTTHAITIAHEGGHVLFGLLMGRGITKVTVTGGGGGSTGFRAGGWLAIMVSFLAGYLGPSIFGFAGAWMLVHDVAPRAVLLMSLALMALLLVMVRNFFGFIAVPLTAAVLWLVAMRAGPEAQLVFAYIWVWFLLMGGVRQIPELYRHWLGDGEPDTQVLSQQTGLSTAFYVAFFWLGSMGALVWGGALMLRYTG